VPTFGIRTGKTTMSASIKNFIKPFGVALLAVTVGLVLWHVFTKKKIAGGQTLAEKVGLDGND
jgi:hypothetical protein